MDMECVGSLDVCGKRVLLVRPRNVGDLFGPRSLESMKASGAEMVVEVKSMTSDPNSLPSMSSIDVALASLPPTPDLDHLAALSHCLRPNATLIIRHDPTPTGQSPYPSALTLSGFAHVSQTDTKGDAIQITCQKPNFELGSSAPLRLALAKDSIVEKKWVIDVSDVGEEEDDLVDPDSLLDPVDLKRPDPASLRVCGTTGKRKACKDCSCGLAEELMGQDNDAAQTNNLPKSSCGSCYLGDAFRCSGCPYAGMPAFKPGERILLPDELLKPDL